MPIFVSRKASLLDHSPHIDQAELECAARQLEGEGFTRDEAERLVRYRAWSDQHGEHAERLRLERRLDFVRWLLEHNRIQH
jgi:hypothetical protein